MDIKLLKGDIALTPSGAYTYITALTEALQKAEITAKIPKGSFIYNKTLGTQLDGVKDLLTAEMLLREALMGSDFEVKVLSFDGNKIEIEVSQNGDKESLEVTFGADL